MATDTEPLTARASAIRWYRYEAWRFGRLAAFYASNDADDDSASAYQYARLAGHFANLVIGLELIGEKHVVPVILDVRGSGQTRSEWEGGA